MGSRVIELKLGVRQSREIQGQLGGLSGVWWFRTRDVSRVNPLLACAAGESSVAYRGHSG